MQAIDLASAPAQRPGSSSVANTSRLRERRVVVAVRDYQHDHAAIDWALSHATPGVDNVHLIHAYPPLHLDGCHWPPVEHSRETRELAGRRVIAVALQRITAGHRALRPDGSAVAGTPEEVLAEISEVADLLVLGDDSNDPETEHRITWRVQNAAHCPVVCVPISYRPAADAKPVTVVVDDQGLPDTAMVFGTEVALRAGVGLQVSRSWSALHEPLPETGEWLAEQQQELDAQLADWRQQYPALPLSARIELDDAWLGRLRRASNLLVAPTRSASLLRTAPIDLSHPCPVATVPE